MDTQVLIAGGGPVGLITAMELNKQGVKAILIERNPTTTRHPKMDITNGRSMELFRRWGVDKKLRAIAIPESHGFDVVWVSNLAGKELTRFTYPAFDEYRALAKKDNDGTRTLEPPMRVSQILIEPALKEYLETECPNIDVRFGWALDSFVQDDEGVTSTIKNSKTGETKKIRSSYLAGCEGAGSVCRRQLGIKLDEVDVFGLIKKAGMFNIIGHGIREAMRGNKKPNGKAYSIHFTSPELKFFERFGKMWHIQSPNGSTIISQNDKDTWSLHSPLREGEDPKTLDPKQKLFEFLGQEIECDIKVANAWTPRLCVANKFGKGRVWMAGDAIRQVTPAGGYGMNTGVADALGLGWALAAVVKGWGSPDLLKAYEAERKPVAIRNRNASGDYMLIRFKIEMALRNAMFEEGPKGDKVRKKIGQKIEELTNIENEAIGVEAGYRYANSPAICYDGEGTPPPFVNNKLQSSTYPGLRVPAVWLQDGRAIPDLLSDQFTLIRFNEQDISAFEQAATKRNLPLSVLDIRDDHAANVYEKKLILVRPDQHVAWRGDRMPSDALKVIDKVRGAG